MNLFDFWDVYDVSLWEKKFGRSTAYSCRTNVFMSKFLRKNILRKNKPQLKSEKLKQDILN